MLMDLWAAAPRNRPIVPTNPLTKFQRHQMVDKIIVPCILKCPFLIKKRKKDHGPLGSRQLNIAITILKRSVGVKLRLCNREVKGLSQVDEEPIICLVGSTVYKMTRHSVTRYNETPCKRCKE